MSSFIPENARQTSKRSETAVPEGNIGSSRLKSLLKFLSNASFIENPGPEGVLKYMDSSGLKLRTLRLRRQVV